MITASTGSGRPRGFAPLRASGRLRRPVRRVIAIVAGPNPSFDYYLAPRLAGDGVPPARAYDVWSSPDAVPPDEFDGALLLFCRYMTPRWLRAAERMADRIAGVGYFIDDDLDALFADPSVPVTYRARLVVLALWHRRRFARLLDVVFASNPRIVHGHDIEGLRLLTPVASRSDHPIERGAATGPVRLAFHSTRVHAREHAWTSAVLRTVMDPSAAELEVFASRGLRALWSGLPATTVRAPLPWPAYRAWTRQHGADLLLAPLLAGPGNSARSPTKRIEALRLGAACLVSDPNIYHPSAEELACGMCVPSEPDAWGAAIRALIADRDRLAHLRDLNRATVLRASAAASGLFRDGETECAPPLTVREP